MKLKVRVEKKLQHTFEVDIGDSAAFNKLRYRQAEQFVSERIPWHEQEKWCDPVVQCEVLEWSPV